MDILPIIICRTSLSKVEPVKTDSQLKSIDAMHFGWNIVKAFGKPRLQTATFIKKVFAHTLRDSEVSTIERKMSHTESECRIKLDKKLYDKDIIKRALLYSDIMVILLAPVSYLHNKWIMLNFAKPLYLHFR